MAGARIYPWRQADPDRIEIVQWDVSPAPTGEPAILRNWDAATEVTVTCTFRADVAGIREDTGLPDDAGMRIGLSWESRGSARRDCGPSTPCAHGDGAATLRMTVPAGQTAGRLRVHLTLWLSEARDSALHEIVANAPGSVLWHHAREYVLEGTAARFPVSVEDFAQSGWRPADAAWHLSWDSQAPENPLMGTVRLSVNGRSPLVARAVTSEGVHDDPAAAAVRETMRWDVGAAMIRGMLACDEFVKAGGHFDPGTVGAHVAMLIRRVLPQQSVEGLAELLRTDPSRLDAQLQSGFRLFAGNDPQ
jgi:hypothetical protein